MGNLKACRNCLYVNVKHDAQPCVDCHGFGRWTSFPKTEPGPTAQALINAYKKRFGDASDPDKHPSHYCKGGLECINLIKAITSDHSGIMAVYVGNAQKYLWRFNRKNGLEDLEKLKQYVQWMIEEVQHGSARD
jgi:hypothetical protein